MLHVLSAQGKRAFWLLCMAWLPHNVIQSEVRIHATCSNLICCKVDLKVGGKTVNIAFELSNISKQIAHTDFLTTHMANLLTFTFILLFIAFCGAEFSMIKVLFFVKSSVTLKAARSWGYFYFRSYFRWSHYFYYIDTNVLPETIPLVKFIKTTSGTRVVYFP